MPQPEEGNINQAQMKAAVAAMNARPDKPKHMWKKGNHLEVKAYIDSLVGTPARAQYNTNLNKVFKQVYEKCIPK